MTTKCFVRYISHKHFSLKMIQHSPQNQKQEQTKYWTEIAFNNPPFLLIIR